MKRISLNWLALLLIMAVVITGCAQSARPQTDPQPVLDAGSTTTQTESTPEPPATIDPYPGNNTAQDVITPLPTEPPITPPPTASSNGVASDIFVQEQAFISIYENTNPAVVHIDVGQGQGSGFVYNTSGYIVTNNHVVADGGPISVTFSDGTEVDAELIGTDPDSDLAVIQVDVTADLLTPVTLADSDTLKIGQMVIAIGNPFGLDGSMTTGIISGLSRNLSSRITSDGGQYRIPDVIQTDAAINPGNSGGPLLDLQGQVIGVNSAIESPVLGSSGIGYAVPSNIVKVVVPQLIANGRVSHPWLGITGGTLTADAIEQLGLDSELRGVLINTIVANGPAAAAGLQGSNGLTQTAGDIIVSIDGHPVHEFDDLLGYIIQHTTVGQTVDLGVWRNDTVEHISLTLGARPTGEVN